MKISICTPCWIDRDAPENKRQPRYEMFKRAAQSIFSQTNHDFEWVIADDISTPNVEEIIKELNPPEWLNYKVVRLPEKGGRIIARNTAMRESTGDWICWFDSDDELASIYVDALSHAIDTYPDYKIFSFNHLIFGYNYDMHVRNFINMEVQGDAPFGSGNIGAGAFIFSREIYDKVGPLPEKGLWDFAEEFFTRHPECKIFFESKEQPGKYHSLGNPFGDDYFYFYEVTRHGRTKYLNTALYYVHNRYGHRWVDEKDYDDSQGSIPSYNPSNI